MIIPARIYGAAILALAFASMTMYAQREKARSALADYRREVAEATRKAETLAREKETALMADSEILRSSLAKEIENAQTAQNRLVAGIRAGTQRMSIAAHCPFAGQAAADSGAAPGNGAEGARAELDPQAAEALVAIAADGDAAIRERNACIAAYDQVKQALN